jgi:hypothetical protein
MSEQLKQGDRKIVKKGENLYYVYVYDSQKGEFVDRWHMDQEGVTNLTDDISSGNTDLSSQPIGTDGHGNPIYRLKKNT